jgi:hypothetical protein
VSRERQPDGLRWPLDPAPRKAFANALQRYFKIAMQAAFKRLFARPHPIRPELQR